LNIKEQFNDGNLARHAEDIHRKILKNDEEEDHNDEFEVIV